MTLKVRIEDKHGNVELVEVPDDDFLIVCGPLRYVSSRTWYPKSGTQALWIKTRKAPEPDGG